jgi:hypothetical protein
MQMLKKTDVYNFIEKVQSKAIDAVEKKYATELASAIETALNKPENHILRDAITSLECHLSKAIEADNLIKKHTGISSTHAYKYDLRSELFGIRGYRYSIPKGYESIRIIHAEREEELRRTKEEYAKIMRIVRNKKTGDQGKTALIALGFDVAYLDKLINLPVVVVESEMKIDKALLFPCGTAGVE